MTVVVGPNGSGKSNVVDALTWVLGTSSPKSLRGGSMADVIFAGAPGKPGMGRARVAITIDNAAGHLPIEFSEVTVSRGMFANGEDTYAINDVECRALDVQELLTDTGLGRETHTIVGQGQLDAILNARPEHRRAFVEEAAGIAKHRRRRERALRKLAADGRPRRAPHRRPARAARQLRPLERQAEAAAKHAELSEQLSASAVTRAVREFAALSAQLGRPDAGRAAGRRARWPRSRPTLAAIKSSRARARGPRSTELGPEARARDRGALPARQPAERFRGLIGSHRGAPQRPHGGRRGAGRGPRPGGAARRRRGPGHRAGGRARRARASRRPPTRRPQEARTRGRAGPPRARAGRRGRAAPPGPGPRGAAALGGRRSPRCARRWRSPPPRTGAWPARPPAWPTTRRELAKDLAACEGRHPAPGRRRAGAGAPADRGGGAAAPAPGGRRRRGQGRARAGAPAGVAGGPRRRAAGRVRRGGRGQQRGAARPRGGDAAGDPGPAGRPRGGAGRAARPRSRRRLGSLGDALVVADRDAARGAIDHVRARDIGRVLLLVADRAAAPGPAEDLAALGAQPLADGLDGPAHGARGAAACPGRLLPRRRPRRGALPREPPPGAHLRDPGRGRRRRPRRRRWGAGPRVRGRVARGRRGGRDGGRVGGGRAAASRTAASATPTGIWPLPGAISTRRPRPSRSPTRSSPRRPSACGDCSTSSPARPSSSTGSRARQADLEAEIAGHQDRLDALQSRGPAPYLADPRFAGQGGDLEAERLDDALAAAREREVQARLAASAVAQRAEEHLRRIAGLQAEADAVERRLADRERRRLARLEAIARCGVLADVAAQALVRTDRSLIAAGERRDAFEEDRADAQRRLGVVRARADEVGDGAHPAARRPPRGGAGAGGAGLGGRPRARAPARAGRRPRRGARRGDRGGISRRRGARDAARRGRGAPRAPRRAARHGEPAGAGGVHRRQGAPRLPRDAAGRPARQPPRPHGGDRGRRRPHHRGVRACVRRRGARVHAHLRAAVPGRRGPAGPARATTR